MTKIYLKNKKGNKVIVVTDEVAIADLETRRAIWRNDAKEDYYREVSIDTLTDKDIRISIRKNFEDKYIEKEESIKKRNMLISKIKE